MIPTLADLAAHASAWPCCTHAGRTYGLWVIERPDVPPALLALAVGPYGVHQYHQIGWTSHPALSAEYPEGTWRPVTPRLATAAPPRDPDACSYCDGRGSYPRCFACGAAW